MDTSARGNNRSNGEEPRRKNRALLEFYGIDAAKESGKSANPENVDTTNIDGAAFDSNRYFHQILKENTLGQLMQYDYKLTGDIKKLDSDMKTLVYENYNKFISATDTIRKMKSNVENMEEEMNRLAANMEKISTSSDQINSTLAPRRDKIIQLSGVHRLLKKLQFLVDLPSRLRKCVQVEAYSQAVNYYTQSSIVLKKYENLPSFKSIQRESDTIIDQLKVTLRSKIKDTQSTTTEAIEVINLLLQLQEPHQELREQFLGSRLQYFTKGLTTFPTTSDDNITLHDHLKELNKVFLYPYLDCAKTFKSLFVDSQYAKKESSKQLEEFTRTLFGKFFSVIQAIVSAPRNVPSEDVYKAVEMLHKELLEVHNQLPSLGLAERASDIINNMVQMHIETQFNLLQASIKDRVNGVFKDLNALATTSKTLGRSIFTDVQNMLQGLKPLLVAKTSTDQTTNNYAQFLVKYCPMFIARIDVKIQQLFLFLNIILQDYHEDDSRYQRDTEGRDIAAILALARLCIYLESEGINNVAQSLLKLKEGALKNLPKSNAVDLTINVQDLRSRFKTSAENLLQQYVKQQSSKLSMMLWKSVDTPNWLKVKDPKTPRSVMEMVVDELAAKEKEISEIFGTVESSSHDTTASNNSTSTTGTPTKGLTPGAAAVASAHKRTPSSASAANSKNFLDKRVRLTGGPIEFNKGAILTEVVKICLKSMVEYVRMKTYSKNGLHQLQLDVYFLRSIINQLNVSAPQPLHSLLDDVITSASERCTEPEPLEASVVFQYCAPKIEKWKGDNENKTKNSNTIAKTNDNDKEKTTPSSSPKPASPVITENK